MLKESSKAGKKAGRKAENCYPSGRKRHMRRCANQIDKSLVCPYTDCFKTYGCDGSLNLHIKVKHHGGTKTDRDKYARQLALAIENGQPDPPTNLQLYPGFREYAVENFNSEVIMAASEHNKSDFSDIANGAASNIVKIVRGELILHSQ